MRGHLKKYCTLGILLCCAAPLSCSLLENDNQQEKFDSQQELNHYRALWQRHSPSDYEYILHRICFCGDEVTTPAIIRVRADTLHSITYNMAPFQAVPQEYYPAYPVIDSLFSELQLYLDLGADSVYVRFDAELGFPYDVFVDLDYEGADEEQWVTINNFKSVGGGNSP